MAANLGKLSIAITATTKGLQSAANKTIGILSSMGKAAVGLPGILGVAGAGVAAKGLLDIADSYAVMGSQLEFVTGNAEDAAFVQEDLYQISKATGTTMADNAKTFVKLSQAQGQTKLSTEENLKVIGAINALMIKTGTAGSEASATMLQLGQALASGRLQGDEFRSMSENAAGVIGALAGTLGVTVGELKTMSTQGEVTSEVLGQAFLEIAESGDVAFDELPETASRGLNSISLAFQKLWSEISTENGILSFVFDGLSTLAEHIESNSEKIKAWAGEAWGQFLVAAPKVWESISSIGKSISGLIPLIEPVIKTVSTLFEWLNKIINITQQAGAYVGAVAGTLSTGATLGESLEAGGEAAAEVAAVKSAVGAKTIINNVSTPINKTDARELGILGDTARARA